MTEKTHFGYQDIPKAEKVERVRAVFDSVANRYDIMNDVMSLGLHRVWKHYAVEQSGAKNGDQVLDLAGGTGDLTAKFAKRVGDTGKVVLSDINQSMLEQGRAKLLDQGIFANVDYVLADAEKLPFEDNSFTIVMIAFGLRNVTDKDAALREMRRVLKPGGKALVLEFSTPSSDALRRFYDKYSFNLIPKMGKWIADDEASYQYLVESIRKHPDQQTLKTMMQNAGFAGCQYRNLNGGIVALHWGYKY